MIESAFAFTAIYIVLLWFALYVSCLSFVINVKRYNVSDQQLKNYINTANPVVRFLYFGKGEAIYMVDGVEKTGNGADSVEVLLNADNTRLHSGRLVASIPYLIVLVSHIMYAQNSANAGEMTFALVSTLIYTVTVYKAWTMGIVFKNQHT